MPRPAPDTETLKRLVSKGLPYGEIAAKLYELTGYETNAKNIGVYISRHRDQLGIPKRLERYDELIPWQVHARHVRHYDLRMLRIQARLDRGLPVEPEWLDRLENWKRKLKEQDGVVAYYWHTADGFYWVPRRDGDLELIRTPEGIEQDIQVMVGQAS